MVTGARIKNTKDQEHQKLRIQSIKILIKYFYKIKYITTTNILLAPRLRGVRGLK